MTASSVPFEPMSGRQIEKIASAIVTCFQPDVLELTGPFDIQRFVDVDLEDLTGVAPDYSYELPEGIYGLTDSENNRLVINAELAEDPYNDKFLRSTLGHEVGHCILHVPWLRQVNRIRVFQQKKGEVGEIHLYREKSLPLYRNPEWQAWRFAGALLMPEKPFRSLLEEGLTKLEISDHFQVNPSFVDTRMRALKMM
jgi:Zn-dependent peptidase ImmA (M78 family)